MNPLQAYFNRMRLDPRAVSRTLSKAHDHVTGETILDATREVLRLSRGERDADDRDSLEFQTARDAADLLSEKIQSDQHGVLRSLLWKATNNPDKLQRTPSGLLDRHVDSLLFESGLGQSPEETNPMDLADQAQSITRLGEGAMPSVRAVPADARNVSPTHAGFVDVVRSPESLRVGIDVSLARNVRKGPDGRLYKQFMNMRTGNVEWVDHKRAAAAVTAIPSREWNSGMSVVPAFVPSKGIQYIDRGRVELFLPDGADLFNDMTELTPAASGVKGMRMLMGSKYVRQATPVKGAEAPLVHGLSWDGRPVPERLGEIAGALRSDVSGRVVKITGDEMVIETPGGERVSKELWNHHPYSRMTSITSRPLVRVGDAVVPGKLLAATNFTDDEGRLAMGTNLRMAWMPSRGWTYEDSAVISRSAADKLAADMTFRESVDADPGLRFDRRRFMQMFPGRFSKDQLARLDDSGVVKPGTVLEYGDPIYVAVKEDPEGPRIKGSRPVRQESQIWKYTHPGTVRYAEKTPRGYSVYMDTTVPFDVGDKIAMPFGSKGVSARVMSDEAMIRDMDGRPLDLVMSSLGVVSRTNPALIDVSKLGKVARHDGRPYTIDMFPDEDLDVIVRRELEKRGIPDKEDLFDPTVGRKIPQVGTGELFVYRMPQLAEKKGKSRGTGAYTSEGEPTKRDGEMAKHYGTSEYNALLSHGVASTVLKDMALVRGQRDDRFMRMFKLGMSPPMPGTPAVYSKFEDMMRAAGIDMKREAGGTSIFAMTDGQARELTKNRVLRNTETFGANTGKPVKGGLFDPDSVGVEGDRWTYIPSPEPMLNPIMEGPVKVLLGLRQKDFDDYVAGRREYNGKTGFEALGEMMSRMDLKDVVSKSRDMIRSGAGSKRDAAVKRLNYADAMLKQGVKPQDFLMTRVPVLPARWRPVSRAGKVTLVADANYLYRELNDAMQDYRDAKDVLPDEQVGEARLHMYDAYRALVGTMDPAAEKLQQKRVAGLLVQLTGKGSPKTGFIQRRLMGFNSDFTGQAVITLNPNLSIDEVGLPREAAWKIYEPYLVRNLVRNGMPATQAAKEVAGHGKRAGQALKEEVHKRPVLINRAPTLHRTSVMAAWPKLVDGHALQIPPPVTGVYGADFDGDHVINTVLITISKNLLDKFMKSGYIASRSRVITPGNIRNMIMASRQADVPVLDGHTLMAVNLEDFPYDSDRLIGSKGHIDFYEVPQGVFVLALDERTGQPAWAPVHGWSVHRDREIWTVTLSNGKQLVTDDDERAVYGLLPGTLDYARRRPAEAKGMLVPTVARDTHSKTPCKATLNISPEKSSRWGQRIKDVVELDGDTGYVFGAMAGDGWVSSMRGTLKSINLSGVHDDVTDAFKKRFHKFYEEGAEPAHWYVKDCSDHASTHGSSKRHNTMSAQLAPIFKEQLGHGAAHKHLPLFWHSAPESFRWGLFSGLLDTDGSICVIRGKKRPQLSVNLSSISLRLVQDTQHMLRTLGIRSRITFAKTTQAGNASWILGISAVDVYRHKDKLICAKQKIWDSLEEAAPLENSPASVKTDLVPVPKDLATHIRALYWDRHKKQGGTTTDYSTWGQAIKKGFCTRYAAREAVRTFPDMDHTQLADWLVFVGNENIAWTWVREAENTGRKETGYDLTVPGYETFMSVDGIILSNTMSYSVPMTQEAVRDAIDKMMPSKNLLSTADDRPNFTPKQDYLMGLWLATRPPSAGTPRWFPDKASAVKAWRRGEIELNAPVSIGERK